MWLLLAVTDRGKKIVVEERSHGQTESFYKRSHAGCVQSPGQSCRSQVAVGRHGQEKYDPKNKNSAGRVRTRNKEAQVPEYMVLDYTEP